MKSKRKGRRYLAGFLSVVMMLTMAFGNITLASDGTQEAAESEIAVMSEEGTTEEAGTEVLSEEPVTEEKPVTEVETQAEEPQQTEEPAVVEEEPAAQDVSIQTTVDGTTIVMSGPASSFPAGSSYVISASKLSQKEENAVEAALEKKAVESKINISSYQAYDIKLLVDGVETQPTGNVNVTFSGTEVAETVASSDDIQVYHVDTNTEEVKDIQSEKKSNSEVEMLTNHFSTYVIANTSESTVKVTVNHYLNDQKGINPKTKLFRTAEFDVAKEERIQDFTHDQEDEDGVKYYEVESIYLQTSNGETDITNQFASTGDLKIYSVGGSATINVYYRMTTGEFKNGTTFFDYNNGTANDSNSINYTSNYPQNSNNNNRLGTIGAADDYKLMVNQEVTVDGTKKTARFNANAYYRNDIATGEVGADDDYPTNNYTRDTWGSSGYSTHGFSWPILTGLIHNLTGENYETVNFSYDEPGFFSAGKKNGKTIYNDYELKFSREGNRYTLSEVYNDKGNRVCNNMASFFPLDSVNGGQKNEYFGMRYDFTFSVGDYLGDMTYSFTGDDDLWVFVDGELVLDLGGIHGAYPGSEYNDTTNSLWENEVDVWEVLTEKENYTEEDKLVVNKDEEHTVTVLFMERGGNASNCNMTFVMPSVSAKDPVITTTPKADLEFTKTTSDGTTPLAGATFELKNSNNEVVGTKTSDENGKVTFTGLKVGNYTLTETEAPTGYVLGSDNTWTVKVTSDDGTTAVATLYDGDEKITSIENIGVNEVVSQNKTAEVINENDRLFKINLDATSLSSITTPGSTKAIDVVLVLDASGSMCEYSGSLSGEAVQKDEAKTGTYYYFEKNGTLYRAEKNWRGTWSVKYENGSDSGEQEWRSPYSPVSVPSIVYTGFVSRNEAMQEAALEFVDLLEAKSPESNVGIAAYSGVSSGFYYYEGRLTATLDLTSVSTGKNTIKNKISEIEPYKSTCAYIGLDKANEYLENSTNDKMVVLLSDGDDNSQQAAKNSAIALKAAGVTIYSVGFKVTDSTKSFLTTIAGDGSRYYGAENMEQLVNSFKLIVEGSVVGATIEDAVIVDYIDPRFEVTDESGNVLSEETNIGGGTLKKDENGNWYVEWTTDIAPEGENGSPGWQASVYVKAKDDFIGGNVIPTNGEAYVSFDGNTNAFPQPTVNVKLLNLNGEDEETTVFIQDDVSPKELIADLKDNCTNIPESCQLTETEIATLLQGQEITKPYSYGSTEDVVGNFTYSLATTDNTSDHKATSVGTQVETYTLKITYTPLSEEARIEKGYSEPAANAGEEVTEPLNAEANHYLNVVAGSVLIDKTISGTWNENLEGFPVFTFKIVREYKGTTETFYRTISFEDTSDNTLTAELLSNLPRGSYTVTELKTQRYSLESVGDNDGSVTGSVGGKSITFDIGVNDNVDNYEALDGKAIFTNQKNGDPGKRTDTDVVMNRFVYDADQGEWKIYQERVPQNPTQSTGTSKASFNEYTVPDNKKLGNLDLEDLDVE